MRQAAMALSLWLERLLEPERAWPLALARSRGGHCGHKHDPGSGTTDGAVTAGDKRLLWLSAGWLVDRRLM
jgi:hypothetical protein